MFNNPYNYYPYMNMASPTANIGRMSAFPGTINRGISQAPTLAKGGLFKSLSGIKWSEVLSNTQKTLNVINQAIPVYYQIKPIFSNVKSFSRLLTAFNSNDENTQDNSINNNLNNNNQKKENSTNSPTFFIN